MKSSKSIIASIEDKRVVLEHLRQQVRAFSHVLATRKSSETKLPAFAVACLEYFDVGTGESATGYTTLIDFFKEIRGEAQSQAWRKEAGIDEPDTQRERREDCIWSAERVRDTIQERWSRVTVAYVQAKLHYTSL